MLDLRSQILKRFIGISNGKEARIKKYFFLKYIVNISLARMYRTKQIVTLKSELTNFTRTQVQILPEKIQNILIDKRNFNFSRM